MNWISLIPESIRRSIANSYRNGNTPPTDFFKQIKNKQQLITSDMLIELRQYLNNEVIEFLDNGQLRSAERILFHLKCVEREQKVIDAGLTKYVDRDDLDDFLVKVSRQVVKIIELENFERRIPNEQSNKIRAVKDLFDQIYIVFTDYTGKIDKTVEKKKQARDPIAFGVFKTNDNIVWNHRFYYICDWVDEYCDLTLDKYVSEMIKAGYHNPVKEAHDINVAELEQRIVNAHKEQRSKPPEWHLTHNVTEIKS